MIRRQAEPFPTQTYRQSRTEEPDQNQIQDMEPFEHKELNGVQRLATEFKVFDGLLIRRAEQLDRLLNGPDLFPVLEETLTGILEETKRFYINFRNLEKKLDPNKPSVVPAHFDTEENNSCVVHPWEVEMHTSREALRERAEVSAAAYYMSAEQMTREITCEILEFFNVELDLPLSERATIRMELACEEFAEVATRGQSELLDRLTDIAEAEGLEAGIDSELSALKVIFPEKENYQQWLDEYSQATLDYLNKLTEILSDEGELTALAANYYTERLKIALRAENVQEKLLLEEISGTWNESLQRVSSTAPEENYKMPGMSRAEFRAVVRKQLLEKREEELKELYKHPRILDIAIERRYRLQKEGRKYQQVGKVSPQKLDALDRFLKADAAGHYSDPENLKSFIKAQTSYEYLSISEQQKYMRENIIAQIEYVQIDLPDNIVEQLHHIIALSSTTRLKDEELIESLTLKAENEGIAAALSEDNLNAVRKNIFRSKEDYIDHLFFCRQTIRECGQKLGQLMSLHTEETAKLGEHLAEQMQIEWDTYEKLHLLEAERKDVVFWG